MPDEKPRQSRGKILGRKKKPEKKPTSRPEPVSPNASRLMLVVNPVAGTGEVEKIWDALVTTLRDLGLDFDFKFTERPEHAIAISREAAEAGYGTVVSVGGDGTLFEVTNGIMAVERDRRPKVGIIPTGRASDFCRTLDIPLDWVTAASFLASGKVRSIDVGWMEYRAADGVRTGYFANIAGLGFDGEVTERANNMPEGVSKAVGGIGTYLLSLVITWTRYKEKDVELRVDGEVYHVLATSCVIANCSFLGGKMRIAPDAICDDGLFDIVVIGAGFGNPVIEGPPGTPPPERTALQRSLARIKMAGIVPALYQGKHVKDDSVLVLRGKKVKVTSTDRMVLQADGEVIGEGSFAAEVIKGALDIIA
ncbi:MAG: diacylglycerol/lipid kinase family protein [Candidatus Geothermincolia bacterium]